MLDADVAFHRALHAASGNPLIERSAQAHWAAAAEHLARALDCAATLHRAAGDSAP